MSSIIYFLVGTIFLIFVVREIVVRIKKKPLSVIMTQQEEGRTSDDKKKQKKKEKEYKSFQQRAKRVNWDVSPTYQQNSFIVALIGSAVIAFVFDELIIVLLGIAAGIFYPFYQLGKKEDEYDSELPLRAEQAVNAVEQQMQSDIPTFEALKKAVPYMQEPLKSEYEKAVERIERANMPIKRAVEDIPKRLNLSELEYFHQILEVAEETEERAVEIVRDSSDTIRRRQKQRTRLLDSIASSVLEMKLMFGLVVVMVLSYRVMLKIMSADVTDMIPLVGTPIHFIMDLLCIGIAAWVTWDYMKKLKPRNIIS